MDMSAIVANMATAKSIKWYLLKHKDRRMGTT